MPEQSPITLEGVQLNQTLKNAEFTMPVSYSKSPALHIK